jgi:hypothetical protein
MIVCETLNVKLKLPKIGPSTKNAMAFMTIISPIAAGSLCSGTKDGRIKGMKTVRTPLAIPKNIPIATTYS